MRSSPVRPKGSGWYLHGGFGTPSDKSVPITPRALLGTGTQSGLEHFGPVPTGASLLPSCCQTPDEAASRGQTSAGTHLAPSCCQTPLEAASHTRPLTSTELYEAGDWNAVPEQVEPLTSSLKRLTSKSPPRRLPPEHSSRPVSLPHHVRPLTSEWLDAPCLEYAKRGMTPLQPGGRRLPAVSLPNSPRILQPTLPPELPATDSHNSVSPPPRRSPLSLSPSPGERFSATNDGFSLPGHNLLALQAAQSMNANRALAQELRQVRGRRRLHEERAVQRRLRMVTHSYSGRCADGHGAHRALRDRLHTVSWTRSTRLCPLPACCIWQVRGEMAALEERCHGLTSGEMVPASMLDSTILSREVRRARVGVDV